MELGKQIISSAPAARAAGSAVNGAAVSASTQKRAALGLIDESPFNPRKTFAKMDELAQSLRAEGMLAPLLVREARPGRYEVIDGGRRLRAARMAELVDAPINVVEMSDEQARIAQMAANSGEPVPELEEAEGYRAILAGGTTVADLVARTGRKETFIRARIKLLDSVVEVKDALKKGEITAGHAILIARLQPRQQLKALAECFDWDKTPRSVRALDRWLDENVRLRLDQAPFKLSDALLVPAAGSCDKCPKRDERSCLDPACFQSKTRALIESKKEALSKKGMGRFVLLSQVHGSKVGKGGVLQHRLWDEARDGDKRAVSGLLVDGPKAGSVIQVVQKTAPKEASRTNWEEENRKRQEKQELQRAVRCAILDAACESIKAPLERQDLEFVAEGFATREDKGVDVTSMRPQQLAHWLIRLSLGAELDGWGGAEPKRLLALAKRYKVNVAKVTTTAEAAFKAARAGEAQTTARAAGGAK